VPVEQRVFVFGICFCHLWGIRVATKIGFHEEEAISVSRRLERLSQRIEETSHFRKGCFSPMNLVMHKREKEWLDESITNGSSNSLAVSLLESQEEERKRISRDLHDGLGQLLTHLKLQTQQCLANVEASGNTALLGDAWKAMEALPDLVTEALQEVRAVCRALRPAILDDLGVLAAITSQCRKIMQSSPSLQIETEFSITEPEIPETAKTVIYRIVQEALTNCIKYADADSVQVSLVNTNNTLILNVRDNGKGFDVKGMLGSGLGLTSMRERAQSLRGVFTVESAPLRGTEVRVSIPLNRQFLS
jgi:two-component system NarL family sensor kinase